MDAAGNPHKVLPIEFLRDGARLAAELRMQRTLPVCGVLLLLLAYVPIALVQKHLKSTPGRSEVGRRVAFCKRGEDSGSEDACEIRYRSVD